MTRRRYRPDGASSWPASFPVRRGVTPAFVVERLAPHHDRTAFHSGAEPLDRYLQAQAAQDERRRISACFVAGDRQGDKVSGYCTLAMGAVLLSDLPEATTRKLPRYPTVPAARLGRLAVDERCRGRGLGGALFWEAVDRASASEIAAFALLVDAKDEAATAFCRHHDVLPLGDQPRTLFLPLATGLAQR